MFKLTNANIDTLRQSIPVEKLSKTFQDAIKVTKALGYSYLWIDSLCIIQDSAEDWQKEAGLMSTVYGDAVVNIAASSAVDGSVGLFFERDPIRESRFLVNTNTNETYELLERSRDVYDISLSQSVLASRGWCFQERFLAKGTLHFTKQQIFYECQKETTCEHRLEGFQQYMFSKMGFPEDRDTIGAWFKAVFLYSGTKLTFSRDKLVAISGVAKFIEGKVRDEYVAGLWRRGLEVQLCWRVGVWEGYSSVDGVRYLVGNEVDAPIPYRAPSWSWAETDQPKIWDLVYHDGTPRPQGHGVLIKVIDVHLDPVGEDVFGQLKDARLKIETGPIFTVAFITYLIGKAEAVEKIEEREEGEQAGVNLGLLFLGRRHRILYDFSENDERAQKPCFFMPVFKQRYQGDSNTRLTNGLILQAAKGRGLGYFTRVGVWAIPFEVMRHIDLVARVYLLDRPPERAEKFLMDESIYHKILLPDEMGEPGFEIMLV